MRLPSSGGAGGRRARFRSGPGPLGPPGLPVSASDPPTTGRPLKQPLARPPPGPAGRFPAEAARRSLAGGLEVPSRRSGAVLRPREPPRFERKVASGGPPSAVPGPAWEKGRPEKSEARRVPRPRLGPSWLPLPPQRGKAFQPGIPTAVPARGSASPGRSGRKGWRFPITPGRARRPLQDGRPEAAGPTRTGPDR